MAIYKATFKCPFNYKLNRRFQVEYALKHSIFLYLVFFIGIFSLYALLTSTKEVEDTSQYVSAWLIAIVGTVYPFVFLPLDAFFSTRRLAKSVGFGTEIFEITRDKIVKYDDKTNKKYILNWVTITKVRETDKAFYFYTNNDATFLIDKQGAEGDSNMALRKIITDSLERKTNGKLPYKIKEKTYVEAKKKEKKELKAKKKANKDDSKSGLQKLFIK